MYLYPDKQSPYYQIIYKVNGKRTKKSTKKTTEAEAQIVFEQFKKDFENQINNSDTQRTQDNNITLSQFFDEYKSYVSKSKSKHYQESIKFSFNQFIDFAGSVTLKQVNTKLIDQFVSYTYSRSESAASLYFRTLKAAFTKAVTWEYIQDNMFKKIRPPKVSKSFPVFISENELILILDKTKQQMFKDIFTTAFYTGMRLGELLNMKWSWIDFNQSTITIKNSKEFKSKSKRERIIPIHPKVKNILQSLFPIGKQSKESMVFYIKEGIKLNEDFVSKQFKKAVRDTDLNESIHFHSLRHSFASALVQRGVSLYAVKELLGHEDINTTQIYSHLQKENLSQAVNLL